MCKKIFFVELLMFRFCKFFFVFPVNQVFDFLRVRAVRFIGNFSKFFAKFCRDPEIDILSVFSVFHGQNYSMKKCNVKDLTSLVA